MDQFETGLVGRGVLTALGCEHQDYPCAPHASLWRAEDSAPYNWPRRWRFQRWFALHDELTQTNALRNVGGRNMSEGLPVVYLARHGETAWSLSGQHTGLTDLPLTENGERNARALGQRLSGLKFAKVFTSPLQRATRTCELAGFKTVAEVDHDLVEWNYGQYEGRTSADIHRERPDWQLFRDGVPGGETLVQVGARADRVVSRARAVQGDVLVFSSGHFLRVLAARWLGLPPAGGKYFLLNTASLSALGYEHSLSQPVIRMWNDIRHVSG